MFFFFFVESLIGNNNRLDFAPLRSLPARGYVDLSKNSAKYIKICELNESMRKI